MSFVVEWLLSLIAAVFFVAVAETLIQDGSIKNIAHLVGGLLIAAVLLNPFLHLDLKTYEFSVDTFFEQIDDKADIYRNENTQALENLINHELCAYIKSQGEVYGLLLDPKVSLTLSEQMAVLISSITLDAPYEPALSAALQSDLGIRPEQILWKIEEKR